MGKDGLHVFSFNLFFSLDYLLPQKINCVFITDEL